MKLWQKIFLCTFLLFEFVFNAASLYFIEYNFSRNLNKEIEYRLTEQFVIHSGLQNSGNFIKDRLAYSPELVHDFFTLQLNSYTKYFQDKGVFIEILDENNKQVYNSFNLTYNGFREELTVPLSDKRKYIIRDIGKQSFLYVTNLLTLEDTSYKLTYIREITSIYNEKSTQYSLFIKLNILITLFLALGLYLLLWYLTRPIRDLTKSAEAIATGNYTDRVCVISNDEIGMLGQTFNQMTTAIQNNIDELKSNSEAKQHFIECLTHELKTPLTSIIGYADFLRSTKYNEEIFIKGLNHIYNEGKRLESLSFKLMDLILLERQEPALKAENMLLLCSEVVESLRPRLETNNIELTQSVASCKAVVERDLFKVLLTNLLDNAVKASKSGSRIYLRGNCDETGQLILEIEDQGIGIPEQDIPKLFEPFYMVDKARSRSHHGAGLGLSICALIVKLHHGRMAIRSSLDKGTKVQITIPQEFTTCLQPVDTLKTLPL